MANDTTGSPVIHLPWAGKRVRIEEVDSIFPSLWKMSADNMRIGANLQVRTSVLNFVICAPDTESAHYASKLLRSLPTMHLARAIIVVLDEKEDVPDVFDSWVTLRCFSMISDMMRYCFEQTTIFTSGKATRGLPGVLSTVLKSNMPVYMLWLGDTRKENDSIFRRVAEMCQRVVVDSATFFEPEQDMRHLANYCVENPEVALSDLNWGRLTPWRRLIAQFFDMPDYFPFLKGIEQIEIEHTAAPLAGPSVSVESGVSPNPTAALLLAGWLKDRLALSQGHTNQHDELYDTLTGTYRWIVEPPEGSSQAVLEVRPFIRTDLRPGSINLVRLTCHSENEQALFTIKRDADADYVVTSAEILGEKRLVRTVNLPARYNEGDLLRNELEITVHDELFEQVLQEIDRLLGRE